MYIYQTLLKELASSALELSLEGLYGGPSTLFSLWRQYCESWDPPTRRAAPSWLLQLRKGLTVFIAFLHCNSDFSHLHDAIASRESHELCKKTFHFRSNITAVLYFPFPFSGLHTVVWHTDD